MQPYLTLVSVTGFSNPLIVAAMPLLLLLIQIKKSNNHSEPAYLQQQLIKEINYFEEKTRIAGCSTQHVLAARYCLTTVIDEFILLTDWSSNSIWVKQSLLSTLHKETWGGERFFIIIEKMSKQPKENLIVLEFLYILLSFGFEGKYYNQAESIREDIKYRLFSLIIRFKNVDKKLDLATNSQALENKPVGKYRLAGWKLFSLTALLVFIVGFVFNMLTLDSAKEVFKQIDQINESIVPYQLDKNKKSPPWRNGAQRRGGLG